MDFQTVIMRLNEFWAEHGCLVWHPYNGQVGAGTLNPATALRVLGPEPWNVAYLEPSVRPDDGRYGENPNRWQEYYQYQVILKPDPGNPIEIYLDSLRALGIDPGVHDVRFVEDNWENPALGAWGLGWEVWLDGQEISQYTYFQQSGGLDLDPVSVEITYGLERIVMVLQGVGSFPEIKWHNGVTYGQLRLSGEVEFCTYNFEVASVENLQCLFDIFEAEGRRALDRGLVAPAHDYVLKCSHAFNVLDARGAVGVTERARFFLRMRDLARQVAALYVAQREEMGHPLMDSSASDSSAVTAPQPQPIEPSADGRHDLVFEIGSEELPVTDLDSGILQLWSLLKTSLEEARLGFRGLEVWGTPRRLVAYVQGLDARQADEQRVIKGPPASIAFDDSGAPTKAAIGFARGHGVAVGDLEVRRINGKDYLVCVAVEEGRTSVRVLTEILPRLVGGLSFGRGMRWNASNVAYSRPLRWYVALLDEVVVPFEYAGVRSGRVSRGIRPLGSPHLVIPEASAYQDVMRDAGIMLGVEERENLTLEGARSLAAEVGGSIPEDRELLREVANLVEYPLPIRGSFEEEYLRLPDIVLLAVMKKHQRYLPIVRDGHLLPYFVSVANGKTLDIDAVRRGNEDVLRARYADAAFFYDADRKQPLAAYTPRLQTLTFQERLGSVLDKVHRVERMVPRLAELLGLTGEETALAGRAASLCKSDLATQMVVEHTSLQGQMGRHYAELSGEKPGVAQAIEEHYLPRSAGDSLPENMLGVTVGLADRLDTLVGLFAVGVKPSGGADPRGLRRAALGVIQLLVGKGINLELSTVIRMVSEVLPVPVDAQALEEVDEFIRRRLRVFLLDEGYRHDAVDAVLAERGSNPALAWETVKALVAWVERDDWQVLLDSYARCVRITRDEREINELDPRRFSEQASRSLYDAYVGAAGRVAETGTVDGFFGGLIDLKPHIDRFFEEVLVMDQDESLRRNRLGLLQRISALPHGLVDLTVMEGF